VGPTARLDLLIQSKRTIHKAVAVIRGRSKKVPEAGKPYGYEPVGKNCAPQREGPVREEKGGLVFKMYYQTREGKMREYAYR